MIWLMGIACNAKGSIVIDPLTGNVEDTAIIDVDTAGDTADTDGTDTSDTSDSNDTSDTTTDSGSTDTSDTMDTGSVEIPLDNNNPQIYPNYWQGYRDLVDGNCVERILEYGVEVTNDFPDWMAFGDMDEIYEVQTNQPSACGRPIQQQFYRGVKYKGVEIELRYWPQNPGYPVASTLLATATILPDGETWEYVYAVQGITLEGQVSFLE